MIAFFLTLFLVGVVAYVLYWFAKFENVTTLVRKYENGGYTWGLRDDYLQAIEIYSPILWLVKATETVVFVLRKDGNIETGTLKSYTKGSTANQEIFTGTITRYSADITAKCLTPLFWMET